MNPSHDLPPADRRAVCCDVAALAGVRVPLEAVAALRRQPGPVCGPPLAPAFLKHADEQTVVGLTAVYQAIHDRHPTSLPDAPSFTDWGVLAAPRFLGRPAMAMALQRFAAEGAWGVSPHLIPHRSLHAISGTVSQALKIHGPNFGVGGGPGAAAEALLTAAAMLACRRLPGVWVVLTAQDPERSPDEAGRPAPGTFYAGLALALVPARAGWPGIRLRLLHGTETPANGTRRHREASDFDLFRLHHLLTLLDGKQPAPGPLTQPLADVPGYGSWLELSREDAVRGEAASPAGHRHTQPAAASRLLWPAAPPPAGNVVLQELFCRQPPGLGHLPSGGDRGGRAEAER